MHEIFNNHPTATWITIIGTIVTIAGAVAGGWYFILDERERSIAQNDGIAKVQDEQVLIRRDMASQTRSIEEIREVQKQILAKIDRRFDKIEGGHDRIVGEVTDGIRTLAIEIGKRGSYREMNLGSE